MQNIQRQLREDGICVLTFDRADSSVNIFDRATLEELESHIKALAESSLGSRGLVLCSAKPSVFVAGADLHSIQKMTPRELDEFIAIGQRVFAEIAALKMPTAAAIHGAAVGGGYEVALACDWRAASPDKSTKIGLPETQLGILPAWGGSTRLPRLIGLPGALDIILKGKTVAAKDALKRGMIDLIAPRDHLVEAAAELLKRGKRAHGWKTGPLALGVASAFVAARVRSTIAKETRGHYPAITKAAEVAMKASAAKSDAESQRIERDAIRELAPTPAAANLIRLFFLGERAKKLAIPGASAAPAIASGAVIGAGVMGSSIAQWLSARGIHVVLRDIDAARVAAGMANIAKLYQSGVKRHTFTALEARRGLDRISPVPVETPLKAARIVIEAAVERMDTKIAIFKRLEERVDDTCLLATNTSALSITELAAATRHPARVVGMHFFNPVQKMQLVEVIVGSQTSPEAAQRAVSFVQRIGKLPVLVKDSPGFLVNRILIPYMLEAAHLFRAGSSIEDIDEAMLDFGMPMGPLRLTDEVGIDVAEDVAKTLIKAFPDRLAMPEILPQMLDAGMRGKKNGEGFYVHKGRKASPNARAIRLRPRDGRPLDREGLERRMVLLMVNEAARCLEEGIAERADDIDFAMVMGTGFAPFRGGPLRYADSVGVDKIAAELSRLAETVGGQFAPCALIAEMARNNKRFHEH